MSAGPEAEACSSSPEPEAPETEPGDLGVEAMAGGLDAAVAELPELDTAVSPATEARLEELAARKAAQAEAAADRPSGKPTARRTRRPS